MLDIKFLRENPEIVKQNIRNKFQDQKLGLVDEVIELDAQKRAAQQEADGLRADRNKLSKQIGALMGQGKKDEAEEVNISYSLTVTSGKAKLVYVSPDGIVSTLAECIAGEESEKSASDSIEAKAGENRIRLVGAEGTSLEYEFTADAGEVEPFGD